MMAFGVSFSWVFLSIYVKRLFLVLIVYLLLLFYINLCLFYFAIRMVFAFLYYTLISCLMNDEMGMMG